MDSHMFDGFDSLLKWGFITLCVSVPLGIWKLVEIVIWVINHLHWS